MKTAWNRLSLVLFATLAVLVLMLAPPALAQAPDLHTPAGILAWLKLQAMLVGVGVTIAWKYIPGLKDLSNRVFLPWLQLLVFIAAVFGGHDVASAAGPGTVVAHSVFWAKFAIVFINMAVSKTLWDGLLKPTLGAALDAITGRTPQTP